MYQYTVLTSLVWNDVIASYQPGSCLTYHALSLYIDLFLKKTKKIKPSDIDTFIVVNEVTGHNTGPDKVIFLYFINYKLTKQYLK